MLHFNSLIITNFGPFKGEQKIDFKNSNGVTIFWGDNGRGKTTLLNALRYALFGIVQRRNGILRSLQEMENLEAREEGNYGFSVVLNMNNGADQYELTRQYAPRNGIAVPVNEEDYEKRVFLKKNGGILAQDKSEHELNIIMPEQVSRFFLFDGELLQEYEELLENETSTGERIKEAIEKILGVPVLTNGIVDIRESLATSEKLKATAMQKDKKTRQFGLQIEFLNKTIELHNSNILDLKAKLSDYYKIKLTLSQKSEETETVRGWIARRDAAEREIDAKKEEREMVLADIRSITKDAWKGMLSECIRSAKNSLLSSISVLEQKKQNKAVADNFLIELRRAITEHKCPVCEQSIADEYIQVLENRISHSESQFAGLSNEEAANLLALQGRLNTLSSLEKANRAKEIEQLEKRYVQLTIDIGTLEQVISDLNSSIQKFGDITGVAGIANDLAKVITSIKYAEDGIAAEEGKMNEAINNRANIMSMIKKEKVGSDLLKASRRYDLCESIYKIFEKGKSCYRDHLKKNVEKDATEAFVHLSGDKDYIGLKIHDNYGLSIVHKSGTLVPGRSSGYEHIVALSLIGALHKNAPLQGPVIMDSPFGRLDITNKRNIIQYLPEMAEQSIFLAYNGEIDSQVVHEALAGSLLREYRLIRVSSMYTRVE